MTGPDTARRQEFLAFIRANHPDVGGDPDVFRRGLDAFAAGRRPGVPTERPATGAVEIHHRRRGPAAALDRLIAARRRRRRPPRVQ